MIEKGIMTAIDWILWGTALGVWTFVSGGWFALRRLDELEADYWLELFIWTLATAAVFLCLCLVLANG